MSRYIDAEKLDFSPLKDDFDRARAVTIVKFQPTADVVEVVRCGNCIHRIEHRWEKCTGRRPDEYCSDGISRRRTEKERF